MGIYAFGIQQGFEQRGVRFILANPGYSAAPSALFAASVRPTRAEGNDVYTCRQCVLNSTHEENRK